MCTKEIKMAFEFAKQVLFKPDKALKKTATIKEGVKYLAVISLLPAIAYALLFSVFSSLISGVVLFVFYMFSSIVGSLIGAGIIHGFGKLFRLLPKDFSRTFSAIAYAETPSILLGWIPIVSIFSRFWALVLDVMGLKRQHGITTGKAILAVVVPIVVIVVVTMMIAGSLAY